MEDIHMQKENIQKILDAHEMLFPIILPHLPATGEESGCLLLPKGVFTMEDGTVSMRL